MMTRRAVVMIQPKPQRGRVINHRATMDLATEARATLTSRPATATIPLVNPTRPSFEDCLKRLFHASSAVD
jgi:hypothetical protein